MTVPLMDIVAFDGIADVLEGIADVLGGGASGMEGAEGAATVFEGVPPPITENGGETTAGPFWLSDSAYVPVELRVVGTVQAKVV